MAKIDVNLYFAQMESQYFEMLENVKDIEEEAQNGNIPPEEYEQLQREVDLLKTNYERLAWIIMLLNKPARKGNEKADVNREWYQYLKGASKEAVINENKDILANLKKYVKTGETPNE